MPDLASIGAVDWTFGAVLVVVLAAATWMLRDYLKGQGDARQADTEWQHELIAELRAERLADTEAYKDLVGQMRDEQHKDTATYIDLTRRMIEGQQVVAAALDAVCVRQEKLDTKQDRHHSETMHAVRTGQ